MLLGSLIISGFLTALIFGISRGRSLVPAGMVLIVLGIVGILPSMPPIVLPAVSLSGLLMLLAACVGRFNANSSRRLKSAVGAIVLGHGIAGLLSVSMIRERQELRAEYPVESLSERLAYETRSLPPKAPTQITTGLAGTSRESFDLFESMMQSKASFVMRTRALMRLHDGVVADFINSPGFGVTRQIGTPNRKTIELPDPEPIPQLSPGLESNLDESTGTSLTNLYVSVDVPANSDLQDLHLESTFDFLDPKAFGYIQDRNHVRGFQSHRFHQRPSAKVEAQHWQVQRIELVSLLKHEQPAVYLSEHLPRMDQLRDARTRPLNPFEKKGLAALQSGQQLASASTTNHLHLLGALRAVKQCLSCHQVEHGDLLGAFSYMLQRDPLVYVPKP